MRLIRVFPRKTKATPDDEFAYFGPPDLFAEADEVHVSVTFTYDKPRAEQLAEEWRFVAPVKVGGVAYGDDSLEFIPGRYVKPGYTITSRGCPRRCWFCGVWKKWPTPNLLPIYDGWNILDDNLLACPREHVEAVFSMLRQQSRRAHRRGPSSANSSASSAGAACRPGGMTDDLRRAHLRTRAALPRRRANRDRSRRRRPGAAHPARGRGLA